MRQILVFAALMVAGGLYAAQYADQFLGRAPERAAVATQADEPRQPASSGRSLTVAADRAGHFKVEGRIDGRRLDFMVDTGASVVALRQSDAESIGIRPVPRDFTASVSTANGTIKAARANLSRIEIGGIAVYDVAALVLPDEALGQNLLGVSFLSRLRRYEYANGRLVLEQ